MIHLIDITAPDADELIAGITEHLPVGAELGRVRVALGNVKALLVDDGDGAAMFGLDIGGCYRVVGLSDEAAEVTCWRGGREVSRRIEQA